MCSLIVSFSYSPVNEPVYILDKSEADGTSSGASFSLSVGSVVFKICHFFELPGECNVVSPPDASRLPQAPQLVEYLGSVLGFQNVYFCDELKNAAGKATTAPLRNSSGLRASPRTGVPAPPRPIAAV